MGWRWRPLPSPHLSIGEWGSGSGPDFPELAGAETIRVFRPSTDLHINLCVSAFLLSLLFGLLFFSIPVGAMKAESNPFPELGDKPFLSVAFASADIGNPESVFGHVFLIAHGEDGVQPNSAVIEFYGLLGEVDFGMLKTVVSHIPGVYKTDTFAEKKRLYDKEGRDLYVRAVRPEVNSQSVISRLEAVWNTEQDYDFLNRNCAFYIERLLVGNQELLDSAWRIRQPHDVFIHYGDPGTERAHHSTVRALSRAVYDQEPESLQYYQRLQSLRGYSASSDLDGLARYLWTNRKPDSRVDVPASNWEKIRATFAGTAEGLYVSYSGFDTLGLHASDPLPRFSRMRVGTVAMRCEQNCDSEVEFFEVQTLPANGFGKTKTMGMGLYHRQGVEFQSKLGLGLGWARENLSIGFTPLAGFDTGQTAAMGHETRLVVDKMPLGLLFSAEVHSKSQFDAFDRNTMSISLESSFTPGLSLHYGNQTRLRVGVSIGF